MLKNEFENAVCEMAAILSGTQCVTSLPASQDPTKSNVM